MVEPGGDLIGADFRDSDIRGANLSHSLFLTQAQVKVARGDDTTCLPEVLDFPRTWRHDCLARLRPACS